MGVSSLWKLLGSSGKPRRLETLSGNTLAVDASIWMHQFLKAMRDSEGEPVRGAHIIGFFRRVCKLLFYGIKPVFVFDGDAPTLKRIALVERRKRKSTAKVNLSKVAEKLLSKRLQLAALKNVTGTVAAAPAISNTRKAKANTSLRGDVLTELPADVVYLNQLENPTAPLSSLVSGTAKKQKRPAMKDADDFELEDTVAETITAASMDPRLISEEEMREFVGKHGKNLNLSSMSLNDASFKTLPVETQHDIITELKNKSRQSNHRRYTTLSKAVANPLQFSSLQIQHLVQRNVYTETLFDFAKNAGVTSSNPGLKKFNKKFRNKPKRIASERAREYVLLQNDNESGYTIRASSVNERLRKEEKTKQPEVIVVGSDESSDDILGLDSTDEETESRAAGKRDAISKGVSEAMPHLNTIARDLESDQESFEEIVIPESVAGIEVDANRSRPVNSRKAFKNVVEDSSDEEFEEILSIEPASKDDEHPIRIAEDPIVVSDVDLDLQHALLETYSVLRENVSSNEPLANAHAGKGKSTEDSSSPVGTDTDSALDVTHIVTENQTDNIAAPPVTVDARPSEIAMQSRNADVKNASLVSPYAKVTSVASLSVTSTSPDPTMRLLREETAPGEDRKTDKTMETTLEEDQEEVWVEDKGADPEMETTLEEDQVEIWMEDTGQGSEFPRGASTTSREENIDVPMELEEEGEEYARFLSSLSNQEPEAVAKRLEDDMMALNRRKRKEQAGAADINTQMITEIQTLLRLFGLPYIRAPMEAESQCAFLVQEKLVDGIVTDDSDVFLFGGTNIYKNMFNQQKYVEEYTMESVTAGMALTRDKLIQLAYLLGSDYTPGIEGVGPTLAMEALNLFPGEGLEPLEELKGFWERARVMALEDVAQADPVKRKLGKILRQHPVPLAFPDSRVRDAYLHPQVDKDTTAFQWGEPDHHGISEFMEERLGWTPSQVDQQMIPLLKEMARQKAELQKQTRLDNFFTAVPKAHSSERIRTVVDSWKGVPQSTVEKPKRPRGGKAPGGGKRRRNVDGDGSGEAASAPPPKSRRKRQT
ncbi:uncharacterized protein EV422DRAFT_497342 [Fimicolochytrium jonesii]|uniref:uncharacterized protein n=1 Tax=Fimicolochytrium jonesii TaxID=1396493 RepID=UPI0022FE2CF6|nr:uncharacterized protein EV422DRAFT_497342 [Fimicolochytrium jonesii]KAI8819852.1 hypothetical protein EV422DRAFT_497342 [Fimicolochytrium jonesii]